MAEVGEDLGSGRQEAGRGKEEGTGSLLRTESRTAAGRPLSPTLRTPHHQPTP